MSGDACQHHPKGKTRTSSKIPVSSPSLNRWIKVRGSENLQSTTKLSQRGLSFMELDGKKRIVRHSAVAQRPQNITTEPRNTVALNRATGTPQTPTRIRSLSLSLSNRVLSPKSTLPKTPPSSPNNRDSNQFYRDWDLDSVTSTVSGLSVASCDHASVAHNGTTFSGRSKKYVVHCPEHTGGGGDYLTPTQRAHRQVKRLKQLLHQTQKELDSKDTDILKLTKEVVELRLYKAALHSPEEKSSSSDGITVREVVNDIASSNHGVELVSSCADSGHYDDLCNSSVHSKESVILGEDVSPFKVKTADVGVSANFGPKDAQTEQQRLVVEYERRLQELVKTHEEECYQMKQKHNDKVDELLQRLSEVNTRYWELVPDLESAKERIKELEEQLDKACKKLEEEENKHKEHYLKMYNQGIEAARLEQNRQVLEKAEASTSRISVPELLQQLEVTQNELERVKDLEYASSNTTQPLLSAKEAVTLWVLGARKAMYRQLIEARSKNKIDPEITLQFLKSAIYYFLTDKENNQGHLKAIQSILGFTPNEISIIDKARMT
ncbi:hypothetical protein FQR65_LT01754 [Abscondita terminalis]|nr:hypothetical protein FQR65_LT01754 [Abscondita terminalis]